jgi:hypothetical protein
MPSSRKRRPSHHSRGAQRPLPRGNPIGNLGVADRCRHCPLHHVEASIVLFLRQLVGTPTKTVAAPTTHSTTIAEQSGKKKNNRNGSSGGGGGSSSTNTSVTKGLWPSYFNP